MKIPLTIGVFKVYCVSATPVKKKVLRTWGERLSFSKDQLFFWNPFNKYKEVTEYVDVIEDGKVLMSGYNVYCNVKTFKKFEEEPSEITFKKYSNVDFGGIVPLNVGFNYSPYRVKL